MAYCCECNKEIFYKEVIKTSLVNKIKFFIKEPFQFFTINGGYVYGSSLVTCPSCLTFNLTTRLNYYLKQLYYVIFAAILFSTANMLKLDIGQKEIFIFYVLLPGIALSPFMGWVWWKYFAQVENFGSAENSSNKMIDNINLNPNNLISDFRNTPTKANFKCPSCNIFMQTITTKSHYDVPINIEQCSDCGGIWFDKTEFYQVKFGEAQNIYKPNKKTRTLKIHKLYCPKDDNLLIQFNDFSFPKDILVETCPSCGGFWFDGSEFIKFQNKIKENKK